MLTKLKLIGCGGHFKVVFDALTLSDHSYDISLCDDTKIGSEQCGLLVDSNVESLSTFVGLVHVSIGNNQVREHIYNTLNSNISFFTITHPTVVISKSALIKGGAFIGAQAIIGPGAFIGEGCIINHAAVVDHDVKIDSYSHIAPNSTLGGNVSIGKGVLVGAGAVVLPGITIGDGATVAAGAVVIRNVEPHSTVKGIPAV